MTLFPIYQQQQQQSDNKTERKSRGKKILSFSLIGGGDIFKKVEGDCNAEMKMGNTNSTSFLRLEFVLKTRGISLLR